MTLPLQPPIKPMLAKATTTIPSGQLYEPKWDGFRSIVFFDGEDVVLGSRNEKPMTRYFPELVAQLREQLARPCILDGEIIRVDADRTRLDFEGLQNRIHPAASRVTMLSEQTPCDFVAFDLLAVDEQDLMQTPLRERRRLLEALLAEVSAPLHLTPATTDQATAEQWFVDFEGAGLDGIIAKSLDSAYQPDKRVMAKIKHTRTTDCVVAGYRTHKNDDEAIGSLLLGLYDEQGSLSSVGVIGAFPVQRRQELFTELQPLVTGFEGHPWNWAAQLEVPAGVRSPRKAEGSRWNGGKDLSFTPLRPELVVEVKYDYLEGTRFRHTAQFVRWRPDRTPESCTFEQLDEPTAFELRRILPGL